MDAGVDSRHAMRIQGDDRSPGPKRERRSIFGIPPGRVSLVIGLRGGVCSARGEVSSPAAVRRIASFSIRIARRRAAKKSATNRLDKSLFSLMSGNPFNLVFPGFIRCHQRSPAILRPEPSADRHHRLAARSRAESATVRTASAGSAVVWIVPQSARPRSSGDARQRGAECLRIEIADDLKTATAGHKTPAIARRRVRADA
jgi:hypothetical protein